MALVTLDVVALLPPGMRGAAVALSDQLAQDMRAQGCRSHFRLGRPFDGVDAGPCEPHVSIFMLAVDTTEVDEVVRATRRVADAVETLTAGGERYLHNPFGAPEVHFRKNAVWVDLQRMVIDAVEPLRRGRLRETDPAGSRIRSVMDDPREDPARRRQLARFGYDEVTETWPSADWSEDRFNPHVTLAWPVAPEFRIRLTGLPPAHEFSGSLPGLAVYGMSPFGTCTTLHGLAPFGGSSGVNAAGRMNGHSSACTSRE